MCINRQHRSNNAVEGWHSRFQRMIVSHHSGIWKFLENSNPSLITLSDSDDTMNTIMNEGIEEDSRTKYSEAEKAIIIQRATKTTMARYKCGVLKNSIL